VLLLDQWPFLRRLGNWGSGAAGTALTVQRRPPGALAAATTDVVVVVVPLVDEMGQSRRGSGGGGALRETGGVADRCCAAAAAAVAAAAALVCSNWGDNASLVGAVAAVAVVVVVRERGWFCSRCDASMDNTASSSFSFLVDRVVVVVVVGGCVDGRVVNVDLLLAATARVVVVFVDCEAAASVLHAKTTPWLVGSLGSCPDNGTACGCCRGSARDTDEFGSGVALVLEVVVVVIVVGPLLCSPTARFRGQDSAVIEEAVVAVVALAGGGGSGGGVALQAVCVLLLNGVSAAAATLVSSKVAKKEATSWPAPTLRSKTSDGVQVATEIAVGCFVCVVLVRWFILLLLPKRGAAAL
jgi:hypothetical protein